MLTEIERQRLAIYEERIAEGLDTFWQVGEALLSIKKEGLYRQTHETFAEYCKGRWGFTARYARYLISAKSIFETLTEEGVSVLPVRESQLRPLSGVNEAEAVSIWKEAINSEEQIGAIPTAAKVKELVDEHFVMASNYPHIKEAMLDGAISPKLAKLAVIALNSCEDGCRSQIACRMWVTNPTVIYELNRLYRNNSSTYDEIAASGYVQFEDGTGVRINQATPDQLRRKLDEEMNNHRREEMIAHGMVNVTIKSGDAEFTFNELRKYLTDEDLKELSVLLHPYTEREFAMTIESHIAEQLGSVFERENKLQH